MDKILKLFYMLSLTRWHLRARRTDIYIYMYSYIWIAWRQRERARARERQVSSAADRIVSGDGVLLHAYACFYVCLYHKHNTEPYISGRAWQRFPCTTIPLWIWLAVCVWYVWIRSHSLSHDENSNPRATVRSQPTYKHCDFNTICRSLSYLTVCIFPFNSRVRLRVRVRHIRCLLVISMLRNNNTDSKQQPRSAQSLFLLSVCLYSMAWHA